MRKSNFFGKIKYAASKLLPGRWRFKCIQWALQTWYKPPGLIFPWNSTMKKVLVILPEDPVEAFHQITNYLQLVALFQKAAFSLLCTQKISPFFRQVHPAATIVEYEPPQRFLFSRDFDDIGKLFFREEFDLCLVLERTPDISLLFVAGKTAAPLRVGYRGAGEFPFLNMQMSPSPKRPYRADQNAIVAQAFGASGDITVRWSVSKETLEEISHMLRELNIHKASKLIGIDVELFVTAFGPDWTEQLCGKLLADKSISCYFYVDGDSDKAIQQFLTSIELPVFSGLSASRCAALITRSAGVISGRSIFFELANLLKKPVIGIFDEGQFATYCRPSLSTKAVTFSGSPDKKTVESVLSLLNNFEKAGQDESRL